MLSEIAFEQIDGNFWFAAYGPFRVVMMKDTGYINATKMCSSGGKDYKDWSRLKSSYQLIQSLENILALENTQELSASTLRNGHVQICWSQLKSSRQLIQPLENMAVLGNTQDTSAPTLRDANVQICTLASPPCIFVKTANNTTTEQLKSGTYIHPDLVPSVAGWISPSFQIMANRVVNGYITQEYNSKLGAMQLQLEQATELHEAATLDAYRAQQQVQQTEQQVEQKEHQLQQKEHRHQVWSSTHAFTMLRLNNPEAKLPYYAVRCKRDSMSGSIKKLRAKHPYSIMV